MQTATAGDLPDAAVRFAAWSVAGSVGVFGLLRLSWTEAHILLPFTRAEGTLAAGLFGAPASPIATTLACSGADALALCAGAVLAYPVAWRLRLAGVAGGTVLILGLNIVRIGTLGRAAASSAWFEALHAYLWPAALTLAIAGYVLAWIHVADRWDRHPDAHAHRIFMDPVPAWRFVVLAVVFVLLFNAISPWYLASAGVLAVAAAIARGAAAILHTAGVGAHATANVLWTPNGGFLVTQECIVTPLIPIYLAAICAYATTRSRLLIGVLAASPIFIALGVARLLVVAVPASSPAFFVHAFYQGVLGATIVCVGALWRHDSRLAPGRALAGLAAGAIFALVLGSSYSQAIAIPAGTLLADSQGAIASAPVFQTGLYLALWVAAFTAAGWKRFAAGLTILAATQIAGLLMLHAATTHLDLTAHVRDVRGWAVAGPLLVIALVVHVGRPRQ